MVNQTIILLTKQFPFGHQETYLFNELPCLVKEFQKIIIVPYDEFEYDEKKNRIKDFPGVEVFCINKFIDNLSLLKKIKREFYVWRIFLFEIFKGRDKLNHIKYAAKGLSQLRHLFAGAVSLKNYIDSKSINRFILYNYWLHNGVVICGILNRFGNEKKHIIVSRAHAYDVYHKDWYAIFPNAKYVFLGFETWKVYNTDWIFPISTHAYNHLVKLFPGLINKFKVARLGVIAQGQSSSIKSKDAINYLVFVSCSNIDDNKRIYRIPQIISLLNRPVKWIHFGSGTLEDVEKVKHEIVKFKLNTSCILTGLVPHSDILNYYKDNQVDLIINLSKIEGIPVSLMEAASFGIPMVATKAVGNPEIVNNDNGFLIDVDFDSFELADRLNNYFYDEQQMQSKRKAARNTFLELYDASKNYPEFVKTIKEMADAFN